MELVKCDHCGKVIKKEDAAVCAWKEINLTWYYCKECDKSLSPREAGGIQMKGREYIERTLDLLVDMANHCTNKEITTEGKSKCADCDLSWNFNIRNHGCLLVNIADNSELLEDLISACEAHEIDYKDRLNKVADIFVTCDEEEE